MRAKFSDSNVVPVEVTRQLLAQGKALQIIRHKAWEAFRESQMWINQLECNDPKTEKKHTFMMRRSIELVAEAWIKEGKKEEREYFLIYLKRREREEMEETVFLKNSKVEMEGSSIDLVVMPKDSSGGQGDLDRMEAVLKIKEHSPLLVHFTDNVWYLHAPVRGKTRLSADKKQR